MVLYLKGRFNVGLYNVLKRQQARQDILQKCKKENQVDKETMTAKNNQVNKGTMTAITGNNIRLCAYRHRRPTVLWQQNCDDTTLTRKTAASRRKETLKWCSLIHGVSHKATADGLWTTMVNFISKDELGEYLANSKRVQRVMKSKQKHTTRNDRNEEDVSSYVYSLKVLYQGGLIGKRKYQSIRNSKKTLGTHKR